MHDEVEIIDTLRRGEQAKALEMARAWVAAAPDNPQAQRLLALLLAVTGDIAAAHATLDRAIALAPDDGSLHYQRATLLVSENRSDEASAELDRSIGADPNELRAYVMQAQIALGRGDLDEADRLARLAARVNPDHPWLLVIQGMVLLHRKQLPQAHVLLARAAKLAPNDIQTRYALGLSFFAQGHLAFAEQAFRGVVEKNPGSLGMRFLLVDAIRRQKRYAEAAEVLEAGFVGNAAVPPDMLRFAGELWLVAGDHVRALPLLRRAVAAMPDDRVALDDLIEALRRQGDNADARHTVEAALATTPEIAGLWSARLSFEPPDGDPGAIADRWQQAIPEAVEPMHVHMWLAQQRGDNDAAVALAHRIIEREPGHAAAQIQLISHLYQTDPKATVAHIELLLPNIQDIDTRRQMLDWLARSQDRAGLYADAVATWTRIHTQNMRGTVPLPARSHVDRPLPPLADATDGAARAVFLYGLPGSGVERVVGVLTHNTQGMLMDRPTATAPEDPLQRIDTAGRIAAGELDAASFAASWRAALPARGTTEGEAIDWLLWWDNALLQALRPQLPDALLLLVLVDPRDMLLDWLLKGTYAGFIIESPTAAAAWMAGILEQVATLIEGDLFPHRELRIDEIADDPAALAVAVGEALDREMQPPPSLGPGRHPPGHWRNYREALAEPFALLAPVAQRLGYPAN